MTPVEFIDALVTDTRVIRFGAGQTLSNTPGRNLTAAR